MPVHSTPNLQRGLAALQELVAKLEGDGEHIVSVIDHGNRWIVVTAPKVVTGRTTPKRETR